jgi:DNA-binding XRE family transcriptional regulator
MTRKTFIQEMDIHLKLVRTEYGYTQEMMAQVLGLSKKTLVEIEKGRSSLGWMGAVAFAMLFSESRILSSLLGGEASDMVKAIAFEGKKPFFFPTMGGKIWWRTIEEEERWIIQQNIISQHYRALDRHNRRISFSLNLEELRKRVRELEPLL